MTKSVKLLLIFLILVAVAIIYFLRDTKSTIHSGEKDFTVENPEAVDQIEISDDSILISLKREAKKWMVNGNYPARNEAVIFLMDALKRLEVVSPLSHGIEKEALQEIRDQSAKVVLKGKGSVLKSFSLYYDTAHTGATVMKMDKAKKPFIVKIKGYPVKDLTRIFSLQTEYWQDNTLFQFLPSEISKIGIVYPGDAGKSFTIDITAGHITLSSSRKEISSKETDPEAIREYLYYFSGISFEPVKNKEIDPNELIEFAEINMVTGNKKEHQLRLFRKPSEAGGNYDLNSCYALLNGENRLIEIFYYDIDPVLKQLDDFTKK